MVIKESGLTLTRPIDIVAFTGSEGSRFSPPLLGSGVVSGLFDFKKVRLHQDGDHVPLHRELKEATTEQRHSPQQKLLKRTTVSTPKAYLEVQVGTVEPGSSSEKGLVGVLTDAYPVVWWARSTFKAPIPIVTW